MVEPLAGVILAGGHSRRLGCDKALITLFDDQPLLFHAVAKLRQLCDEVLVVTDRPGRYAHLDLPARLVVDLVPNQGPLGGIHAGLTATQSQFALVVACDMPFLNLDLIHCMAGLNRHYDALVPVYRGRWQSLHAIYARSALPVAEALLAQGGQEVLDLLKRLRIRPLGPDDLRRFDPHGFSFFNLNQPQDLARARAIRKRLGAGFLGAKSA